MRSEPITLFLCGDVMTGRGIGQIMPNPSHPRIYEAYVKDAGGYVELAERENGPIPRSVDPAYIWGDALDELERVAPDVRIINLETSITTSEAYWKGKGINYRMHPENRPCLTAAKIDCCTLANNHVLDGDTRGWPKPSYATFLMMIHLADRDYVQQQYEESVLNRSQYNVYHRLTLESGKTKFVNERCRTFYDELGRPTRSLGTILDMSDHEREIEKLARAEAGLEVYARGLEEEIEQLSEQLEREKADLATARELTSTLQASIR